MRDSLICDDSEDVLALLEEPETSLVVLRSGDVVYRYADEQASDVPVYVNGDNLINLLNDGRLRCGFFNGESVWRLR